MRRAMRKNPTRFFSFKSLKKIYFVLGPTNFQNPYARSLRARGLRARVLRARAQDFQLRARSARAQIFQWTQNHTG